MDNPISWDYLTATNIPVWGPFSVFYVVLFGFVLLGSVYISWDASRRFAGHKLKRDTLRTGAAWLTWISAIALFFFAVRWLDFPLLSFERRIWMYLSFAAFLSFVAYAVYYLRNVYPQRLAAFDRSRERRRWQHTARTSRASARRAAR